MNNKSGGFTVQIECIENMNENKVVFYTHPVNKEFLEMFLDVLDRIINIDKERE